MVTIMCSFSSVISCSWKATQITFAFQQKLPTYLSREFIPLLTMYSSHHKTNKQTPTKSKCIFMLSFNSNPSKEGCGEDYGSRFTRLGGCACCCHYHPWRQQSVQEREHQTKLPNQPPKSTPVHIEPTSTISICVTGQLFSQPMWCSSHLTTDIQKTVA